MAPVAPFFPGVRPDFPKYTDTEKSEEKSGTAT